MLNWQRLLVGYGSNDNRLRIRKGWSEASSSEATIIDLVSLSDEDSYCHLYQKIWMYHFSNFTSILNYVCCQYFVLPPVRCGALSCIATWMLCYNVINYKVVSLKLVCLWVKQEIFWEKILGNISKTFSYKRETLVNAFEVKTGCVLNWNWQHWKKKKKRNNANLTLIWLHHHFWEKKMKMSFYQKYWCWSPRNALLSIPPLILFAVQVPEL